jgi:hypothetical protein
MKEWTWARCQTVRGVEFLKQTQERTTAISAEPRRAAALMLPAAGWAWHLAMAAAHHSARVCRLREPLTLWPLARSNAVLALLGSNAVLSLLGALAEEAVLTRAWAEEAVRTREWRRSGGFLLL